MVVLDPSMLAAFGAMLTGLAALVVPTPALKRERLICEQPTGSQVLIGQ